MADKFTIQRLPVGLLDLLGMQSTGDTPNALSSETQAVIDLTDYYLTDRLTAIQGTTGVIGVTGAYGSPQIVPAGFQWLVYGITFTSVNTAAATGLSWVPAIYRSNVNQYQMLGDKQVVGAAAQIGRGTWWERPVIMRPGDYGACYVTEITGAPAVACNITAFFVPIRI